MREARLCIAALFLAASLTLAGCTKSADSSAGNEATASPAATAEAGAAATAEASAAAAVPSAAATAAMASPIAAGASASTVAYTDIASTIGQKQISDLAALGVFGPATGAFNPNGPLTRAEFVKWLVQANNAIWASVPEKQIHPSQGTTSSYPDVATSHPDFPYIQGMYDAGFAVGFPDKTFKPAQRLTREQMIAIKESVDRGGVDKYYVSFWQNTTPDWKDKNQINKQFQGAIAEDWGVDRYAVAQGRPTFVIGNVPRTFGAIAMLRPQQAVTRAEAAVMLWKVGAHTANVLNGNPGDAPRSAADALAPATPTPTP
jgi:S-layer homology domain